MNASVDNGAVPSSRSGLCGKKRMNGADDETKPLINIKPLVLRYYNSLESRLGYKLVLGGTRHFGYWEKDTYWPFPLNSALRAMEEKVFNALRLPAGSRLLDSGCGDGIVALEMYRRGKFEIVGIDLVARHLSHAWKRILRAEQRRQVPVGKLKVKMADFHHLFPEFVPCSFDGVYACESLAHAVDVPLVLRNYYKLLRPGGRICFIDYEHLPAPANMTKAEERIKKAYDEVIALGGMPANWGNEDGTIEKQMEEAGFRNIEVHDFSTNILPLLRLFFVLAVIPYFVIRLLGLEKHFVNTTAGVWWYKGRKYLKFKLWSAEKPATAAPEDSQA